MLLFPGDLLLMCGAARYGFTHGIAARTEDAWGGGARPRGHRVSITLRRMRDDVHVLTEPAAAEAAAAGGGGGRSGRRRRGKSKQQEEDEALLLRLRPRRRPQQQTREQIAAPR